jgi:choline dehydrogenase-like flavoprotein
VSSSLGNGSLAALAPPNTYDVLIIGSGPAGTLLGTTLAGHGVRTRILESGRGLVGWLSDRRLRSLAEYDYTGDTNYPLSLTTSRILGGNSNFWTGRCERLHPSDFESHPYTPADNPWPIGYADREPVLRCGGEAAAGARGPAYPFLAAAEAGHCRSFRARAGHLVSEVLVRRRRRRSGGLGNSTDQYAADLQRPARNSAGISPQRLWNRGDRSDGQAPGCRRRPAHRGGGKSRPSTATRQSSGAPRPPPPRAPPSASPWRTAAGIPRTPARRWRAPAESRS